MSSTPGQGTATNRDVQADVAAVARRARAAALRLANLSAQLRNAALLAAADALVANRDAIVEANQRDLQAARLFLEQGTLSAASLARLKCGDDSVAKMAERVREVAALYDPLGRTLTQTVLEKDLILRKVSCPLGVIAIVFESRPDVIPQVSSLALKSGNAVLLKGGKEAFHTNNVLFETWQSALKGFAEIPADSVALLHTREEFSALLTLHGDVDLIVPRGSKQLVEYVMRNSLVPVLGHGDGICHVYVDRAADLDKALAVAFDSKVQYPAACNAAETLLVHSAIAVQFLPEMIHRFRHAGVEVRGCDRTRSVVRDGVGVASEDDWRTEYSDLIISVKVVDSTEEAITHVNTFGSKHTESIVTEDAATAERFMNEVDAAGVYHNASTRFADGYRYGLGSEIGISTGKLHARGPVGLEGLTTYKYKLVGNGHTVAKFGR